MVFFDTLISNAMILPCFLTRTVVKLGYCSPKIFGHLVNAYFVVIVFY